MASDLKIRARRQIHRLRVELASTTGRVAALRYEIKRHEVICDMLNGRQTGRQSPRGRSAVGAPKRKPHRPMVDWNAVFATLPGEFTLDTLSAHETASGQPRAYLRQVIVRWSKEGLCDHLSRSRITVRVPKTMLFATPLRPAERFDRPEPHPRCRVPHVPQGHRTKGAP